MLVPTISFEIHDFKNNVSEQFLVENTDENWEKILGHRYTRNIQITKTFAFQFEKEERAPVEFIEMATWMRLLTIHPELLPVAE